MAVIPEVLMLVGRNLHILDRINKIDRILFFMRDEMKKSLHLIRQKFSALLHPILCIFLLFFASACGDTDYSSGDNRSSENGSISFSVEWQGAPTVRGAAGSNVTRALDCITTGVSTVEATVYDQSGNSIASGGPWNCAAGSGRIDNVPVGFNYIIEIMGKNQWGDIIYQGEKTGINVYAGETAYAGEITVSPYSEGNKPDLTVTITNVGSDGTYVTIYYDVYNNGNADAGPFYVDVWPDPAFQPVIGSDFSDYYKYYDGLSAGNYINDNILVSSSLYSGTAYCVVDIFEDIDESDENNNISSRIWPTNSLGMTFNLIPAGTFMMGSPSYEPGRDDDETQHQVTFTQAFYMQTTEVTQDQWVAVMGSNPSGFSGCSDCPVEQVSWNDIQTFITNLNALGEGTYRLPTEAEWEYAARAGSTTAFANGDITYTDCTYDPNLDAMGWYCYNSSSTQSVGQKDPNDWGLYDMHGNVYEWCQDWYGAYPIVSVTDPTGPYSGSDRVIRGAGWWNSAMYCRSAYRGIEPPDFIGNVLGFRLVRNP